MLVSAFPASATPGWDASVAAAVVATTPTTRVLATAVVISLERLLVRNEGIEKRRAKM